MQRNLATNWRQALFLANTAAQVLFWLALAAVGLSCLVMVWDPCAIVVGAMLVLVGMPIAWTHYAAVFRQSRRAANSSATLYAMAAVLSAMMGLPALVELAVSREREMGMLVAIGPVLVVGCWMFASAMAARQWASILGQVPPPLPGTQRRARFSMRELILGITALAAMMAFALAERTREGPQYGLHLSANEAPYPLPAGASDVNYCRGMGGTYVLDFQIDETGFWEWAKTKARDDPQKVVSPLATARFFSHAESWIENAPAVTITNGYDYQGPLPGIDFAYDKDRQRAFFYSGR